MRLMGAFLLGGDELEIIAQALPAIISGVSLAIVSWIAKKMASLAGDFNTLKESQRNQLKADIVALYERTKFRGSITPMELDSVNRLADSYFALGGNHYVHAIIKHMNEDTDIRGESIPED